MKKIAKTGMLLLFIISLLLIGAGAFCMAGNNCGVSLFVTGKLLLAIPVLSLVIFQAAKQIITT